MGLLTPVMLERWEFSVNSPFIDLEVQYRSLKTEIDIAIQSVLDHTPFILGPEEAAFERSFTEYLGIKHVISIGSGPDTRAWVGQDCLWDAIVEQYKRLYEQRFAGFMEEH